MSNDTNKQRPSVSRGSAARGGAARGGAARGGTARGGAARGGGAVRSGATRGTASRKSAAQRSGLRGIKSGTGSSRSAGATRGATGNAARGSARSSARNVRAPKNTGPTPAPFPHFQTPFSGGKDVSSVSGSARAQSSEDFLSAISPLLTRRNFLIAGASVGVVAIAATGMSLVKSREGSSDIETLSVPTDAVSELDSFSQTDAQILKDPNVIELTYGSLVFHTDDSRACYLSPTETGSPLCQVGLINLSSGDTTVVLEKAHRADEGYEIFDARVSSAGLVWLEANILQGAWSILAAPLSASGSLGNVTVVDSGDATFETPSIAVSGDAFAWQLMPPTTSETYKKDPSYINIATFSSPTTRATFDAHGRMACPITNGPDGFLAAVRHKDTTSYFDLVYLDSQAQERDSLTLPSSMSPSALGYGPQGFSFCFDSIYDFGDGIANLGTYLPIDGAAGSSYQGRSWFRFSKTPQTSPCWTSDGNVVVKSTYSLCALNLGAKTYETPDVDSGATDWGEFLASSGTRKQIVTITHINHIDSAGNNEKTARVKIYG